MWFHTENGPFVNGWHPASLFMQGPQGCLWMSLGSPVGCLVSTLRLGLFRLSPLCICNRGIEHVSLFIALGQIYPLPIESFLQMISPGVCEFYMRIHQIDEPGFGFPFILVENGPQDPLQWVRHFPARHWVVPSNRSR